MPANHYDLKQLIYLIKENKDFDANLILDEGCGIDTTRSTHLQTHY